MQRETKTLLLILTIWFIIALIMGISGFFRNASAVAVAITVWTLTGLTLLLCWTTPSLRSWIATVDLRWLVAFHLTRLVGVYFLVLSSRGALPPAFAKPAGIGDMVTAVGAAVIVLLPQAQNRRFLQIWNTFGLIDILFVVVSALRCGLRDWHSMAPLRELPLSLLPMFIVPLIITSHIVMLARLARRPTETRFS
ncbi:MAG: hypothetical protein ABI925_06810 [Verrucomicrobiota bacterium]